MLYTYSLLFLLILSHNGLAQKKPFIITEKQAKEEVINKSLAATELISKKILYEDEDYEVTSNCKGEWGGSILFKNKKTGLYYAARATCVVAVHYLKGKYYVTNSLAHLSGGMDIMSIENPDKLLPVTVNKKGIIHYEKGIIEVVSRQGTHSIVDSFGITCTGSFPYRNQLYYIINKHQESFLAVLKEGTLITLQKLSSTSLSSPYNSRVLQLGKQHYLMFFHNQQASGYIEVKQNKITILREK